MKNDPTFVAESQRTPKNKIQGIKI